jgi:VanZ family protein
MRVGIDIDGVLADMDGAPSNGSPGKLPLDFWEILDELEPGMVKQLAEIAAAEEWEVFFLTRRPETGGDPAQIQSERWLERHGFPRPCVDIVRGSRGKLVHALGLDLLIDDTLDNCLEVSLESKAASILIWSGDATHARRSLRGMNVDLAASFGDVLERLTGRALDRTRRRTIAAQPPTASVDEPTVAPESAVASADRPNGPPVLTRRTFAVAALAFGGFAVYGSLVPLEFRAVSFEEALDRFSRVPYLQLGIQSRADFVANILLFVPLGFLLMGALRADRRGPIAAGITGALAAGFACALANAIEFTQIYFPMRTVSQNDIFAETTGALVGISLWGLVGQRLTDFMRAFFAERQRPAMIVRLLAIYAAAFLVAQVLPLDIAITPGELSEKYHAGRILVVPFSYSYTSPLLMLWDFISDMALSAPVGALAVLGWAGAGRRRRVATAAMLGMTFVAVVEIAQLFIFSRYSDVTDLLTGTIGVLIGVTLAARRYSPAGPPQRVPPGFGLWPALGAVAWAGGVVTYHWYPFNFVVTGAMMDAQLPLLLAVPFRHYYFGSEFHAFTELSRKLMLSAPLGALLWMALPAVHSHLAQRLKNSGLGLAGFLFFAGLEAGQVFLPGRIPDLTDAGVGAIGVAAGIWLVRLFERPRHELAIARHVELRH